MTRFDFIDFLTVSTQRFLCRVVKRERRSKLLLSLLPLVCLTALHPTVISAQQPTPVTPQPENVQSDLPNLSADDAGQQYSQIPDEPRFSAYKRSFIIWSEPNDETDEHGLQVRFSAKYLMVDCLISPASNFLTKPACQYLQSNSETSLFSRFSMGLSYTTDFDFYIASDGEGILKRESQPVRNRMTSPAFHLRWNQRKAARKNIFELSDLMFSVVHHSNGQDRESKSVFPSGASDSQIRDAVVALSNANPSWMDGVSRGWNYLELKLGFKVGGRSMKCERTISCVLFNIAYKMPAFTDPSDEIWWEPGNDSKYTDYNRGTLQLINEWGGGLKKRAAMEISCGDKDCSSNVSLRHDVKIGGNNFIVPFMLYGHFGKNEHFYNYHDKSNMIGFGLEFSQ